MHLRGLSTLLASLNWVDLATCELLGATAAAGAGVTAALTSTGSTTFLSCLYGVDLAVGEFTSTDSTVCKMLV